MSDNQEKPPEKQSDKKPDVDLDEIYDLVLNFLKDLKPPNIHEFQDDHKIIIPFTYTFPNKENITLNVDTRMDEKWVQIKCLLMLSKNIPDIPDLEETLHKKLLQANFNFAEVTYSLDDENNIFSEADMPIDTDFTNFKSEFVSVVFAIDYFFKNIVPGVSEEIKKDDTYKSAMYT